MEQSPKMFRTTKSWQKILVLNCSDYFPSKLNLTWSFIHKRHKYLLLPSIEIIVFSSPAPKLIWKSIDKLKVFPWKRTSSSKDIIIWQTGKKIKSKMKILNKCDYITKCNNFSQKCCNIEAEIKKMAIEDRFSFRNPKFVKAKFEKLLRFER